MFWPKVITILNNCKDSSAWHKDVMVAWMHSNYRFKVKTLLLFT